MKSLVKPNFSGENSSDSNALGTKPISHASTPVAARAQQQHQFVLKLS
jgi:hypothetical protein